MFGFKDKRKKVVADPDPADVQPEPEFPDDLETEDGIEDEDKPLPLHLVESTPPAHNLMADVAPGPGLSPSAPGIPPPGSNSGLLK